MAGVHPFTDTQDSHPGGTQHPQAVTMDSLSSPNSTDFIYKGANKHHWAKLHSKIKQRLMAENISYIDDEEEVARISMPPPPAIHLALPSHPKTRKRDRDNRNSSTSPERRRRTSSKNTETTSPKTTRRVLQHTTSSFRNPSSPPTYPLWSPYT